MASAYNGTMTYTGKPETALRDRLRGEVKTPAKEGACQRCQVLGAALDVIQAALDPAATEAYTDGSQVRLAAWVIDRLA